jgi:hypothetical protein
MDAIRGALGPQIGPAEAIGITAIRDYSGPDVGFSSLFIPLAPFIGAAK